MRTTHVRLALAVCAMAVAPAMAASALASACDTLSASEAERLLGGPLAETERQAVAPADVNGNDRQSSCGRFPKGYRLEGAEAPPERGVLVELHTLPSADAARRFHDGILHMQTQMAGPGGAGIARLAAPGEGAYLRPTVLPGSTAKITTLTFRKGATVASVQVWTRGADVDAVAKSAAAQVASKLP